MSDLSRTGGVSFRPFEWGSFDRTQHFDTKHGWRAIGLSVLALFAIESQVVANELSKFVIEIFEAPLVVAKSVVLSPALDNPIRLLQRAKEGFSLQKRLPIAIPHECLAALLERRTQREQKFCTCFARRSDQTIIKFDPKKLEANRHRDGVRRGFVERERHTKCA